MNESNNKAQLIPNFNTPIIESMLLLFDSSKNAFQPLTATANNLNELVYYN